MFDLQYILITVPIILFAITVHEFAHAKVADMLGDPTPRYAGRLTLNPVSHIDPIGFLMLFLVGFGWAKPVPINPNNFSDWRRGSAMVGLAGPLSNFFAAWLIGSFIRYFPLPPLSITHALLIVAIARRAVFLNVALAVFNLIPIPPLDGHHVLEALLPERGMDYFETLSRYGFLLLVALLLFRPFQDLLLLAVGLIANLFL